MNICSNDQNLCSDIQSQSDSLEFDPNVCRLQRQSAYTPTHTRRLLRYIESSSCRLNGSAVWPAMCPPVIAAGAVRILSGTVTQASARAVDRAGPLSFRQDYLQPLGSGARMRFAKVLYTLIVTQFCSGLVRSDMGPMFEIHMACFRHVSNDIALACVLGQICA